jgi:hypothetical protein
VGDIHTWCTWKRVELILQSLWPCRCRIEHAEKMPSDCSRCIEAMVCEPMCDEMIELGDHTRTGQSRRIRQRPVPQASMMGAYIADIVKAADPTGKKLPVGKLVFGSKRLDICNPHAAYKVRQQSKIPQLDRNPYRQFGVVFALETPDEFFVRAFCILIETPKPILMSSSTGSTDGSHSKIAV